MGEQAEAEFAERLRENNAKAAAKAAKEAKRNATDEATRRRRTQLAIDRNIRFRTIPKRKADVEDLAYLLHLPLDGTVATLTAAIKSHLQETPLLKTDSRFAGLYGLPVPPISLPDLNLAATPTRSDAAPVPATTEDDNGVGDCAESDSTENTDGEEDGTEDDAEDGWGMDVVDAVVPNGRNATDEAAHCRRTQLALDMNVRFRTIPKRKADVEDLAYLLHLPLKGTIATLTATIKAHLQETPLLKTDPRFAGLYHLPVPAISLPDFDLAATPTRFDAAPVLATTEDDNGVGGCTESDSTENTDREEDSAEEDDEDGWGMDVDDAIAPNDNISKSSQLCSPAPTNVTRLAPLSLPLHPANINRPPTAISSPHALTSAGFQSLASQFAGTTFAKPKHQVQPTYGGRFPPGLQ
ncbi:hypothetical protein PUNSTDRAFT_137416 [Punctularia strigosozonata HHB-11173 SS5]|uniref:uncharacterized protein n=1 Tax=Punctularia strigosozonata (strain HHB-11173) TaxID=741275 RepID=UPI000441802C|nr:uncharacterized protein PUNSTDRAFT_137416 [Punctularia strigosozonata HHB-11173 SS5]EIN05931.1 hypothetical protein PUNSTDRAFT_137416 [Punctularia strigosozonata HHB-11173 SS5]